MGGTGECEGDLEGMDKVCEGLICRNCWTDDAECILLNDDDEYEAVAWGNPTFHFDDVFQSLRTIYIIATLDEWTGKIFFFLLFFSLRRS